MSIRPAAYSWRGITPGFVRQYALVWIGGTACFVTLATVIWGALRASLPMGSDHVRSLLLMALLAVPVGRPRGWRPRGWRAIGTDESSELTTND